MSSLSTRTFARYATAAVIVLVIAGLFLVRTLGGSDDEADLEDGTSTAVGLIDDRGVAIGEPVPDFVLATVDGEAVRLSDFRGKTLVLNFWATWCPPCRAEMPDFQALFEEREGAGDLVILAVDKIDEDSPGAVRNFIDEFGLTFPVVLDTDGADVTQRFDVRGLPATFFIDRDGVLRGRNFGPVFGELLEEGVALADSAGASAAR